MSTPVYTQAPSLESFCFSTYATSFDGQEQQNLLWQTYVDTLFPQLGQGEHAATDIEIYIRSGEEVGTVWLSELLHTQHSSWPPEELKASKDYYLVEGLYRGLVKAFCYDYLTSDPSTMTQQQLKAEFVAFLDSDQYLAVTHRQTAIFLWVYELLSEMLIQINDTTLSGSGYLLAMTNAELAAARMLDSIEYQPQANQEDYETQAVNMNLQKRADVYRANRSACGKQGQQVQSLITSLRDQATQQSQLMTSIIESMEGMTQSILKK